MTGWQTYNILIKFLHSNKLNIIIPAQTLGNRKYRGQILKFYLSYVKM